MIQEEIQVFKYTSLSRFAQQVGQPPDHQPSVVDIRQAQWTKKATAVDQRKCQARRMARSGLAEYRPTSVAGGVGAAPGGQR